MTPRQWQRARRLFEEVCDLAPEQQADALRSAGESESVVRKVQGMLESERAGRLGERLGDQAPGMTRAILAAERIGQRLGPYTVTALINRGGMGEIYRAQRSDGSYEAQVAIKFVALASAEMAARFERERQMLARLEHPNIARLLDGGVDQNGVPFLVMEYVDGDPVDRYCNQRRLSVNARLNLFLDLISAVSRAHRQLIIHRDIKPGNILVDGHGQPKLLDFGIGKDIATDLSKDARTLTQGHLLTPHYAAPEQVNGGLVGTHTDVFQLGLLLDELLCGVPARKLRNASIEQIVTQCLALPVPARERFWRSPDRAQIAADRGTSPVRLARALNSDLRLILKKACAPEPEQRYHNVDELAEDIRRYSANRPVSARNPSRRYMLGKFVRRHRLGVGASLAAIGVLCAALIFSVTQGRKAERQRQLAIKEASKQEQVKKFVLDIFSNSEPGANLSRRVTAESLLNRTGQQLAQQVTDPALYASISQAIGGAYFGLGLLDEAEPHLTQALERFEATGETLNEDYAAAAQTLGELNLARARYDLAYVYLQRSLNTRRQLYTGAHPLLADSLLGMARAMRQDHAKTEILKVYREALEMVEQFAGTQSRQYAQALGKLANYHGSRGEFETAFPISERAFRIGKDTMPKDDPELAALAMLLGTVASDSGRFDLARSHLTQALQMFVDIYGDHHPQTLAALANLSGLAKQQGDNEAAVRLSRQYLDGLIEVFGNDSPKVAYGWNHLGSASFHAGNFEQSLLAHDRAIAIHESAEIFSDPNYPLGLFNRGSALHRLNRPTEALHAYQRALDAGAVGGRRLATLLRMAEVLLDLEQHSLALARAEHAASLLETQSDPVVAADVDAVLGASYVALKQSAKARRHLHSARRALAENDTSKAHRIRQRIETQLALVETQGHLER